MSDKNRVIGSTAFIKYDTYYGPTVGQTHCTAIMWTFMLLGGDRMNFWDNWFCNFIHYIRINVFIILILEDVLTNTWMFLMKLVRTYKLLPMSKKKVRIIYIRKKLNFSTGSTYRPTVHIYLIDVETYKWTHVRADTQIIRTYTYIHKNTEKIRFEKVVHFFT